MLHSLRSALLRAGRYGAACLLLLVIPAAWAFAEASSARECLDQAVATTNEIGLGGDQSAARREIAIALIALDVSAAREVAARISRPSDAARALGGIAAALATQDRPAANQVAATAARLLLRIADANRRLEEQRLFLGEIAALGAEAPAQAPDLRPEEARRIVVVALARTQPDQARQLMTTWSLTGPQADPVLALLAPRLVGSNPDEAVALAGGITSPALRDTTLWQIAELQAPAEAFSVVPLLQDPVIRDGALASAILRLCRTDPEAALAAAEAITVSPASVRAEMAVELGVREEARAATMARQLPPAARDWALGRLSLALADDRPGQAEAYLAETGRSAEAVRLVAARMAPVDPDRALRLARTLPDGVERAMALAAVAAALAPTHLALARDLIWEMEPSPWKSQAVTAVARQLAAQDSDAATSVLGLIVEDEDMYRARAQVAAVIARRDPDTAQRLLDSTPKTAYRADYALAAARTQLASSRAPEAAVRLAAAGVEEDLALRWLLPAIASAGVGSVSTLAEGIKQPYVRTLALVDAARTAIGGASAARPAPERGRMIRTIVAWEETE